METDQFNLKSSLLKLLDGRVCIVGVGNRRRADDGAGPCLIDQCLPDASGCFIDAGVAPENYFGPIASTRPDSILIVDAVDFGGRPGEWRLIDAEKLNMNVVSTHCMSLETLNLYLTARTGVHVLVLAIQPSRIDVGEGLSRPVEKTVNELARLVSRAD